ncbi:MAG: carboxypeptidase regulatory-like domain-containing protein, partial [Bacteroidota bacterium]
MRRYFTLTFLVMLISGVALGQGVTTASINGQVIDENGEPLFSANVTAVHEPSGTFYGNSTNFDGLYRIPNMRVGGPYTITVSFTGYDDIIRENVFLTLGQSRQINEMMQITSTELDEVLIVANRADIFDGNRTGQETVVGEKLITEVPTISRAIGDFARLNPLANISEGNDGFTISLAGQNNRYNTIYIDGAVNNDVFGLAGSGTNGGQTGVSPISIDAIEQFQIAVAPFDVRQSGFAGGSINAVTRSGSNKFEGSAYYFFRNEDLAGKTPTDNPDVERRKLSPFSAKTYGFRLGGPIIKNKAFFFVNAELQRDDTPQPFNIADYRGDIDAAGLTSLANRFQESFGYDVGPYDDNTAFLNSDKVIAKLDFNLSRDHKLSLRHSYTFADNLEGRSSSSGTIRFLNGSESFLST